MKSQLVSKEFQSALDKLIHVLVRAVTNLMQSDMTIGSIEIWLPSKLIVGEIVLNIYMMIFELHNAKMYNNLSLEYKHAPATSKIDPTGL